MKKGAIVKEYGLWNEFTLFGIIFFILGIIASAVAINFLFKERTIDIIDIIFSCTIVLTCLMAIGVGVGLVLFFPLKCGSDTCYYCGKRIYNYHKRIAVEWDELTKYSGETKILFKAFHKRCHIEAKEKFRIPNPQYKDIEI